MKKELKEKVYLIADKVTEYSLYAVAFFIPISIAAIESFICFALLGFCIKKIILPDYTFIKSRIHFVLLFFIIFCSFSLLNSGQNISISLNALFFKWGQYILVFFMVQDTLVSKKRIRNTVGVFLFVGCFVALDGFSQRFLGWEFFRGKHLGVINGSLMATTGPFKHYNGLAAYLVCVLILFVSIIFVKSYPRFLAFLKDRTIYWAKFLLLFLLVGCLFLTFSRGGWLGFLIASLLMLILTHKWKLVLLPCLFMLVLVSVPGIRERVMGGDSGRFNVWSGTFAMIKYHPLLGVGIGTFMANLSQYTKGVGVFYAHNCYLQIWAETGIFALLSFISFISLLLWQGVKAFRKSHDYIVLGVLCAIFGFLVHSFFDVHLYSLQLAVLFWFLAGMLAVVSKDKIP
ncbi:MAG: O-antigen ligase family protein [Candidatus Omnitrophica bacterium]|nr:O-antigen ligase family protein [Candidatus Omnitrophota bacterium]